MKNIFLILVFISSLANAQTHILPLETKGKRIQGVYYKDLDNELESYIGVWTGKINGNIFKLTFEKVKEYDEFRKIWKDKLYGRYEMKDVAGNVLYSTYSTPKVKLRSYGFWKSKEELNIGFMDTCISGDIYLKFTDSAKKQLEWRYIADTQIIPIVKGKEPDCAKINEMPQEKFILTKQ